MPPPSPKPARADKFMRQALDLARRGYGRTSPNPMVGAVVVRGGRVIGRGWHRKAGQAHAEVLALNDAARAGQSLRGATLYVTLEPCCTHGRTPPCTEAIIAAGVRRVVVGSRDPNPRHRGRGLRILRAAGIQVWENVLRPECEELNEAFFHWIVCRQPFVTVKAAMTLDGKIATARGESKWITGLRARAYGMRLRQGADAVLVGINTVLADDPSLTVRLKGRRGKPLRRIILDAAARTPLNAKVVSDEHAALTTIVAGAHAPKARLARLRKRVTVLVAPSQDGKIDLAFLLKQLGDSGVVHLLVEGGGEVNAAFLLGGKAQRIAFFYAPKVLGGKDSRPAVAGEGARDWAETLSVRRPVWLRFGEDWLMTGRVG